MEEVIGSIPIRSTNYFRHLGVPPFCDFVANSKTTPRTGFVGIVPFRSKQRWLHRLLRVRRSCCRFLRCGSVDSVVVEALECRIMP